MTLPVAHRAVHEAAVAADELERPLPRNPVRGGPDHDGQFALEIILLRHARPNEGLTVADET